VAKRLQALTQLRKKQGKIVTAEEMVQLINEYPNFLALHPKHQLPQLASSLPQVLGHALDLSTLRNELCQNPERRGHILDSICIGLEFTQIAEKALDLLAGPKEFSLGRNGEGQEVMILTDLSIILNSPIQDLKNLLPTHFDSKGRPVNFPDKTLGGLFPNGDIFEKLNELGKIKQP